MARRLVVTAVLSLAFAGAGSAVAAPPNVGKVYHSVQVAPGTTITFTVTCPPGYAAVAGGMVAGKLLFTGAFGPLLAVTRVPPNAYRFTLGVPAGDPAQFLTVSVRCMRIGVPQAPNVKAVKLKIGTGVAGPIVIPAHSSKSVKVKCPTGEAPTGGGYDENQGATNPHIAGPGTYPRGIGLHPTASMPVPSGWNFTFANSGSQPGELRAEVDCVKRHYVGFEDHRPTVRDEVIFRQTTFNDVVGHSETTVNARCPVGDPLGSGFQFPAGADLLAVTGARRSPAGFTFDVLNGEPTTVHFTEYELCDRHMYAYRR